MSELAQSWSLIQQQLRAAAGGRAISLVAVSKTQAASAIRALAALGQRSFGENYVQEARPKQAELDDLELDWHLIGPLQSNKCAEAAQHFDWVQSLDRAKLIPLLGRARPPDRAALNVLIQVNISDESSKSGCSPQAVPALAAAIAVEPRLRLRGLMAIPAPWPDAERRQDDFRRMREQFARLALQHPEVDTLSMGMSDDFALAIAAGATMVRIGSALFGSRGQPPAPTQPKRSQA
ncbi:MAG: YggS family pyridoxal phosphate-dependent enzyme [Lysobacterales bacterium CG02_land_8_20_14_3_00_62_12]|nr:MAG: YggS family pyridoxal phosphate-dependent enzyme [Xanthomonadales bacterium CG02_land_8_20_14_3_00_62_12]